MQTVNIHEAETHLSKLIAKAGKPMVKVVAVNAPEPKKMRRIGFGDGKSKVPDDIKTMFKDEIEEMFFGKE
jgi:antitoxin (DNA-binding transcriptional repressor) of toxin-antitoxin stability system